MICTLKRFMGFCSKRRIQLKPNFAYLMSSVAVLAVLSMLSIAVGAQEGKPIVGNGRQTPLPPGGPAPRLGDGHVDFSGVWYPGPYGMVGSGSGGEKRAKDPPVPFQPWAAAKIKAMTPTELQLAQTRVVCAPLGIPGIWVFFEFPFQLVQVPGVLVQLVETNHDWSLVHTDGRSHQKDPDPAFNGDAVGHWEGDTLVIDVIAIDEHTWNNRAGWFHSDQDHVIERISRPSTNYLTYQYTIEDPKVLTKPWTSAPKTFSLGRKDEDLLEYYCTNNQEPEQLGKLRSLESGGKK
jgi:hypothetical protein